MKTIGLLGGTSWPSTPLYYEYLNRKTAEYLGGHHAAEIILYSIDYHEIKSLYNAPHGWQKIPALLSEKMARLADMGPDCILICNNTLHRALPYILPLSGSDIPVIDLIACTGRELQEKGVRDVLLLGTKFTMEDGFFAQRLEQEYGLTVATPDAGDRSVIQEIQSAVSAGVKEADHGIRLARMVGERYADHDAVILACTELPLIAAQKDYAVPLINTIHAQCNAALAFSLKRCENNYKQVASTAAF